MAWNPFLEMTLIICNLNFWTFSIPIWNNFIESPISSIPTLSRITEHASFSWTKVKIPGHTDLGEFSHALAHHSHL